MSLRIQSLLIFTLAIVLVGCEQPPSNSTTEDPKSDVSNEENALNAKNEDAVKVTELQIQLDETKTVLESKIQENSELTKQLGNAQKAKAELMNQVTSINQRFTKAEESLNGIVKEMSEIGGSIATLLPPKKEPEHKKAGPAKSEDPVTSSKSEKAIKKEDQIQNPSVGAPPKE